MMCGLDTSLQINIIIITIIITYAEYSHWTVLTSHYAGIDSCIQTVTDRDDPRMFRPAFHSSDFACEKSLASTFRV